MARNGLHDMDNISALRRRMRDAGFQPIPCEGKAPTFNGWLQVGSASDAVINHWKNGRFSKLSNTGLLAKTTPGFDIDILDPPAVEAAIALVRERYAGKGRILKRVGLPPKALIPFRTEVPFDKIKIELMPPGAIEGVTKPQGIEFLGSKQQFIAAGIHPDTGLPYVWNEAGAPGEVHRDALPPITVKEATELVNDVAKLMVERFGYTYKSESKASGGSRGKSREITAANPYQAFATLPDIKDVASAMRAIPNDDMDHDDWKAMGLRIYMSTGGSDAGLTIWNEWSKLSKLKDDPDFTRDAWRGMKTSPPDHTGFEVIAAIAREHGWQERLKIIKAKKPAANTKPVKAAVNTVTLKVAERQTAEIIDAFFRDTVELWVGWKGKKRTFADLRMRNPYIAFACVAKYGQIWGRDGPPGVIGLDVDMGVGKTEIAIHKTAAWLKQPGHENMFGIYMAPTHVLAEEIRLRFIAAGVDDVEVWKGLDHSDDPDDPKATMCLNRKATNHAIKLGLKVYEACCKHGKTECIFFKTCRHVAQRAKTPRIWITTHEMAFTSEKTFEGASFVIIDEDASRKGLNGIENAKSWIVPLKDLERPVPDLVELQEYRQRVAKALRQHAADARHVKRDILANEINSNDARHALYLEWQLHDIYVKELGVKPGSLGGDGKHMTRTQLMRALRLCNQMIKIWSEVRDFIDGDSKIDKSGRLLLAKNASGRVLTWRGVEHIKKPFRIPTLLVDGTLAKKELLRVNHPQAVVAARIRVEMPASVHVTQVLQSPTSSTKLDDPDQLAKLRRAFQSDYLKSDRADTLLITQQNAETWFQRTGLPDNVATAHFNNLVGLNEYKLAGGRLLYGKEVKLLTLIGRTQPPEAAILTEAEALSGRYIEPVVPGEHGAHPRWRYHAVERFIQLRNGDQVMVVNYAHPDPFAEAVRYQICEAQQSQGLGRGRWVRRTGAAPLHIVIFANNVLPLTVDEVVFWQTPSGLIDTAMGGVMLTSPADMSTIWNDIWRYPKAAKRDLKKGGVPVLPGFQPVIYRRKGPKLKNCKAWFDTRLIAEPAVWDGWGQLGGLAFFGPGDPP